MTRISHKRHRFPATVIQHAVWLCFRWTLSLRDVEEMLAVRGIDVSYETIAVRFIALRKNFNAAWRSCRLERNASSTSPL